MATRLPSGVVTMSISVCKSFRGFSRTTIEKNEVPAEMLLVRCATLFVATIPVPASPSGGQSGIPASRLPVGSSFFAPSSVRIPAASPATRTLGSSLYGDRNCDSVSAGEKDLCAHGIEGDITDFFLWKLADTYEVW